MFRGGQISGYRVGLVPTVHGAFGVDETNLRIKIKRDFDLNFGIKPVN